MVRYGRAWCLGLALAMALVGWTRPVAAHDDDGACKDTEVGASCEADGNKCTREKCDAEGKCAPTGEVVTCERPAGRCDGGKACDPGTGTCVEKPDKPAGTSCEADFDKCTPEACDGKGECVPAGPPVDCDDGDVCTDDRCAKATGECRHVPDPSNDPGCKPDTDVEVDKDARCECKDGGGDPLAAHVVGDGDVVRCEGSDDGESDGEKDAGDRQECLIAYKITVTNTGAGGVAGVRVTDVLPARVSLVASDATQGLYDAATGLWDVGDLGSAGMAMLTLEVVTGEGGSPAGAILGVGASHVDDDASRDDGESDGKSDDDSSDDEGDRDRILIENCAELSAIAPPDQNPGNDADCVIVSVPKSDRDVCHDRAPRWFSRSYERASRLLAAGARADSPARARKLMKKATRAIARAERAAQRLDRLGKLGDGCLMRLRADVRAMASAARRLAP